MTTQHATGPIGPLGIGLVPEFDLADRMAKSLRVSGIGVSEMAHELGVTRETVGRWINGRGEPKSSTLLHWASVTQVNLMWLHTGQNPMDQIERARRYSKPQPSDLWPGRHLVSAGAAGSAPIPPESGRLPHAAPAVLSVNPRLTLNRRTRDRRHLHLVRSA